MRKAALFLSAFIFVVFFSAVQEVSATGSSSYLWTSNQDWRTGTFTNTTNSSGDVGLDWQLGPYAGWAYRKQITVNNTQNAGNLTDYQVLVNLTNATGSANFDFSRARPDGDDTRFTYLNATSGLEQNVSFWIETWNLSAWNAKIWVKVPYVPPNGNGTLYMYYGNSSATGASNGNGTFVFFRDFDNDPLGANPAPGWTNGGSGNAQISSTVSLSGSQSLQVNGNEAGDWSSYYQNAFSLSQFTIEAGWYPAQTGGAFGLFTDVSAGAGYWQFGPCVASIASGHWGYYSGGWVDKEAYTANRWYRMRQDVKGTAMDTYLGADSSGDYVKKVSDVPITAGTATRIYVYGDSDCSNSVGTAGYVDNLRVRKYASVEPNAIVGGEQARTARGTYVSNTTPLASSAVSITAVWNDTVNWRYRVPINVTNLINSTLTDYQINVSLDSIINSTGLVGSWHFSETNMTPNSTADSSGYGNTGVLLNGARLTPDGKAGNAANFDGTDDYVDAGAADGSLSITGNKITIEAWVLMRGTAQEWILGKMGPATGSYGLYVHTDNTLIFGANTGSGWSDSTASTGTVGRNTWQHVAVVYNSTAVTYFINGTAVGLVSRTGNLVSSAYSLKMGWEDGWNSQRFDGLIDEVRIYNRTLSASEIQQHYNATKARLDLQDVRFTDSAGVPLPFWQESDGRAWVKVPSVPSGSSTIYMYYGNPFATDAQNGTGTFEFFDDFSGGGLDGSKWTVNTGTYSTTNGALRVTAGSTYIRSIPTFGTNTAVTTKIKSDTYGGGSGDHGYTGFSDGTGRPIAGTCNQCATIYPYGLMDANGAEFDIATSTSTYGGASSLAWADMTAYHNVDIIRVSATSVVARQDDGLNTHTSTTYTPYVPTNSLPVIIGKNAIADVYYDWVLVRKYASPEPSVSVLPAQETVGPYRNLAATDPKLTIEVSANNGTTWHLAPNNTAVSVVGDPGSLTDMRFRANFSSTNDTSRYARLSDIALFVDFAAVYSAKTYGIDGKARSFFAVGENVTLRAFGPTHSMPMLTLADNETVRLESAAMANKTSYFEYNYTVSGNAGWWNATFGSSVFSRLFYVGRLWQGEGWADYLGRSFPFRIQLNVSEPNVTERYWETVDIPVTFPYKAKSVRVTLSNGTSLIEIPSQLYNTTSDGTYLTSGNVVFLSSSSLGANGTYRVHYSRSDFVSPDYGTDLNATNFFSGAYYEVQNIDYRLILNRTYGGLVQDAYHKRGTTSGASLAGFVPMQLSPSVAVGPYTYRGSDLTNPSTALSTGSLLTTYTTSGEAGTMRFNLTYKFYSHAPYFLVETNVTPKAFETWDYYLDQQFFLKDGYFAKANWMNSTGIFEYDIGAGAGASQTGLGNPGWIAAYNNVSRNAFASIFLGEQKSRAYSPNVAFYDAANYEYFKRTLYSGTVDTTDYFYSKVAVVMWDAVDNYRELNDTYYMLGNPINATLGAAETNDDQPPQYGPSGYAPQAVNDTQDVTCYSYWADNLLLDYATVTVNSSAHNNQTVYQINSNSSWVNYTIGAASLEAGSATCNITVYDIAGLSNYTSTSFNVTDATPPRLVSLVSSPDKNASLDPNVRINVTVNLTEYTNVSSVILQYRLSNSTEWLNGSMGLVWNGAYNYTYAGSFTPDSEGVWQYRVFANDTGGNGNYSSETNLSVFYDWTWTLAPAAFGAVSGILSANFTVGNLIINNTGDMPLGFRLYSNWDDKSQVLFNGTAEGDSGLNMSVLAGGYVNLTLAIAAKSTERSDGLTVTISALNSSAQPQSNTTTATIISYASGPFMYVTIPTYVLGVTQGDTGVTFRAKVQNKGNETATGSWLAFDLPSDWTVTSGSQNTSIGALAVNDIAYNQITVSVSDSASTGTKTITASAGNVQNKTGSSSIAVAVAAKPTTTTTTTTVTTTVGGGGGGGATVFVGGQVTGTLIPAVTPLTVEQKEKLFQTKETYELVRGMGDSFTLRVENPFNSTFERVSVSVVGFLSKYLRVIPSYMSRIPVGKSAEFVIEIEAPKYFTENEYPLAFTIAGVARDARTDPATNTTTVTITNVTETRQVTLLIHEIPHEEAESFLDESRKIIDELRRAGVSTGSASLVLARVETAMKEKNYDDVATAYNDLKGQKDEAFAALELLNDTDEKLKVAASDGLKAQNTARLVSLARAALKRGDFATALKRADDARTTYALETAGKINPVRFFVKNWPRIVLVGFGMLGLVYAGSFGVRYVGINRKLRRLNEEEGILLGLIKEAQRECFERGKLSMDEYVSATMQYEHRLSQVVQETISLQTKRASLFKLLLRRDKDILAKERNKLIGLIKETQAYYTQSGKLETRIYENRMKSYRERLAEIDENMAELTAKEAMNRGGRQALQSFFLGGKK